MTKFLSNSYAGIIELLMWLMILAGIGCGISSEVTDNRLLDAVLGFLLAAFITAFFFGPILILIEIRNMVGKIEQRVVKEPLHDIQ